MKNVNYKKSIIVGFLAVYVMSMFFSTTMLERSYSDRHRVDRLTQINTFQSFLTDVEVENWNKNLLGYLLTFPLTRSGELEYNQCSAAIYNKNTGVKIAQSSILMTDSKYYYMDYDKEPCNAYAVGEYFTEEEREKLVQIQLETQEAKESESYPPYMYTLQANKETHEPIEFGIWQCDWDEEVDGGIYHPLNSKFNEAKTIWHWYHPEIEMESVEIPSTVEVGVTEKVYRPTEDYFETEKISYTTQNFKYYDLGILVPYLDKGYENWKRWQSDEHLQNFPDLLPEEKPTTEDYSQFAPLKSEAYVDWGNGYVLLVRQTSNSWLAAVDYMKYVYLAGFVIMLACMLKVLYATEKTYKERAKLEENRRDFTNAIAHELKTPLGVIRGFAENLQENTNEEKREYYLEQIVGQTERMDEMVKEMIYISKLDSDKFVLDKEEVSFKELIEEALESLRIYIEEKQLQISYKGLSDKVVEGDPLYLKKAIWNIMSNAVEYNHTGGQVTIIFEEASLKVQNTGNHIPEEDLPHVFEMFYTGNKSRTSDEKHLGLGLYLAKKIFDLHGIHISINNIEDGVEVVIQK